MYVYVYLHKDQYEYSTDDSVSGFIEESPLVANFPNETKKSACAPSLPPI